MEKERFCIPDREIEKGEVFVGVASTPEEKVSRLLVATDRYIQQGYLQGVPFAWVDLSARDVVVDGGYQLLENYLSSDIFHELGKEGLLLSFNDISQLYLDIYHWQSIQFLAKTEQGIMGSVRLIMNNSNSDTQRCSLPTLTDKHIQIEDEWRERVKDIPAELSQLAIVKGAPFTTSIGLLRAVAQFSRENNIDEWVATTDNKVIRLLNGYYYFGLPKIGPPVKYLGSDSTPVLINIEQSIQNAESEESSALMARFLRGEDVEGFEWYTGV